MITLLDDVDVRLVSHVGSDRSVIAAARVSTIGEESVKDLESTTREGLIRFLMNGRHGTPFEHAQMTFFIKAPIFVFREFHRHRIGWSYNEESARYKQLEPHFYIPNSLRPGLMQEEGGKPGQYVYKDATPDEYEDLDSELLAVYDIAYQTYEALIQRGVAKEIARMCLPVGIFSSMWATCNPRSLMAFLSLRTKREAWQHGPIGESQPDLNWEEVDQAGRAKFPSKPQWEINRVADLMELEFQKLFPITYEAFENNGRVAP